MRFIALAYGAVYVAIVVVFAAAAVVLVGFAGYELWQAVAPSTTGGIRARFDTILEAIGLATISVAALELSQTILEEEVQRRAPMSAPTRVRRFLSRFLIVVVVSLAIECLVGVFSLLHHDPSRLPQAAAIGVAAAALLFAWGYFIRANVPAERLEPEAAERAKREDDHVETT